MAPSDFGPLVESVWLEEHLQKENLRIFDTTSFLIPVRGAPYGIKSGIEGFQREHIPDAGFLDLDGELSNRTSPFSFMMPSAEQFGAVVSEKGVSDDSWVILYSVGNMMWSTRIWWMFLSFGFDRVAVLNGGWDKWQRESRPVSSGPCAYPSGVFRATPRPDLIASRQEVRPSVNPECAPSAPSLRGCTMVPVRDSPEGPDISPAASMITTEIWSIPIQAPSWIQPI